MQKGIKFKRNLKTDRRFQDHEEIIDTDMNKAEGSNTTKESSKTKLDLLLESVNSSAPNLNISELNDFDGHE